MNINPLTMNNHVYCIQKGTRENLTGILIIHTVLVRGIPQPFQAITSRVYQISWRTFDVFSKSVFPIHQFEAI